MLVPSVDAEGRDRAAKQQKHIIGATADAHRSQLAASLRRAGRHRRRPCSLHVEKIEIKDQSRKPLDNIGKTIRVLDQERTRRTDWVEAIIAGAVRVQSSVAERRLRHRYKVRLTLEWNDFTKEVLVTLNDRTDMEYPAADRPQLLARRLPRRRRHRQPRLAD